MNGSQSQLELLKRRAAAVINKQKGIIIALKKKLEQEIFRRKSFEEEKIREVESIRREVEIERMKNVQLSVELQKQNFTKKEIDTIQDMSVADLQITQLKEQLKLEMTRANRKIIEQEDKISTMEIQFETAKNKLELQLEDEKKKREEIEKKFEVESKLSEQKIVAQKKEMDFRESVIVEKTTEIIKLEESLSGLKNEITELTKSLTESNQSRESDKLNFEEELARSNEQVKLISEEKDYLYTLTQNFDFVALTRDVFAFKEKIDALNINESQKTIELMHHECQSLIDKCETIDRKLYDGFAELGHILTEIENRLKSKIIATEAEAA